MWWTGKTDAWRIGTVSILLLMLPATGAAETSGCTTTASLETGITWRSESSHSLLLKPNGTYLCKRPGRQLEIKSDATIDYRPEEGTWGESTADESISYEKHLGEDLALTLDAAYGYERILDENASGARLASNDHTIEASAGMEWEVNPFTFKLDIGVESEWHSMTRRDDGVSFDRSRQDYIEPEVALRISAGREDAWQPFVEVAYMGRRYVSDRSLTGLRRHMAGPEFIAGVQKEGDHIEGQIAAILLARSYAERGVHSPAVIGPYVDITLKPDDRTEITFAAAAQIDQETTGDIRGNPFYSSKLAISYQAAEDLKLLGSASFEFDDEAGRGGTLTIAPELKLTWQYSPNAALVAGAGISWEKSADETAAISATLQAGWSFKW